MNEAPRWAYDDSPSDANVIVTGLAKDKLDPEDLMKALERENPKDEMGHWCEHTKAEVLARARELLPGFPKTTYPGSNAGKPKRHGFLMGVKLFKQPSTKDGTKARTSKRTKRPTEKTAAGPTEGTTKARKAHNSQTPKYAVQRPPRACWVCEADISHRHPNARKCRDCRYHPLPITELRRSQSNERECLDCGTNISLRAPGALRCEECAPEHQLKHVREYRSRPEVQERDRKYRADPEVRARQSSYQKEYYQEQTKSTVRKVKAEIRKLKVQQDREKEQENQQAQDQDQAQAQAREQEGASQHEEALRSCVPERTRTPSLQEPALTG